VDNLPLPLPIREPSILRVNGKCGNILNHKNLKVLSVLRVDFFKNNLYLNICLLVNFKGCKRYKPDVP
jgi:hypothetical protein